MNKSFKKFVVAGVCGVSIFSLTAILPTTAMAAQSKSVVAKESVRDLKSQVSTVRYSDMVKGDGVINFNVFLPSGVKLTTTDPYVFSDALTQNYDISISEGVHFNKDNFSINVNWANQGIKYLGDWVININGSVFTDGKSRTLTIGVVNDLVSVGTPRITTNVDKGVTRAQLNQGFDLVMNIENAKFNTICFGSYIRQSIINTSGIRGINPVAYCNALKPNQVKMRVQAMNGVESWRTHFEFKIEGNASNSKVPITVRIPIVK
ncbi:MAG: hypothetical protein RSB66_07130 [Clostridium sp.]